MLVSDDAPWPRYFIDALPAPGLIYRYNNPYQEQPWLQHINRKAGWYLGTGSYRTVKRWATEGHDKFYATTAEELIRVYGATQAQLESSDVSG